VTRAAWLAGRAPFGRRGARPTSLAVPQQTGIAALRRRPRSRSGSTAARVWLGLRPDAEVEEDRLDVVVYRRLDDTLPMGLDTEIELDVAGQSREVVLEGAALEGFVGKRLDAEIPAQLMPDGKLRVQVRPGTWTVTLKARAAALPAQIARAAVVEPWPTDEIWSFAPESRLRVASLDGVAAIDAAQRRAGRLAGPRELSRGGRRHGADRRAQPQRRGGSKSARPAARPVARFRRPRVHGAGPGDGPHVERLAARHGAALHDDDGRDRRRQLAGHPGNGVRRSRSRAPFAARESHQHRSRGARGTLARHGLRDSFADVATVVHCHPAIACSRRRAPSARAACGSSAGACSISSSC
jgi:hypothetical protein